MKRLVHALVVFSAVALAAPSHAVELQKPGQGQVWPGKFMIGFHPLGFQASFDGYSTGGFKLDLDIAYRVKEWSKLSLWFGGMASYTLPLYTCSNLHNFTPGELAGCGHDLGLLLFVRLTFEKLLPRIPLVPYVEIGLGADILIYGARAGGTGTNIGEGIPFRIGGGIHYWVIKNLGVGAETHFAVGPGVYPSVGGEIIACGGNSTCTSFFGYWDFLLGVRASF